MPGPTTTNPLYEADTRAESTRVETTGEHAWSAVNRRERGDVTAMDEDEPRSPEEQASQGGLANRWRKMGNIVKEGAKFDAESRMKGRLHDLQTELASMKSKVLESANEAHAATSEHKKVAQLVQRYEDQVAELEHVRQVHEEALQAREEMLLQVAQTTREQSDREALLLEQLKELKAALQSREMTVVELNEVLEVERGNVTSKDSQSANLEKELEKATFEMQELRHSSEMESQRARVAMMEDKAEWQMKLNRSEKEAAALAADVTALQAQSTEWQMKLRAAQAAAEQAGEQHVAEVAVLKTEHYGLSQQIMTVAAQSDAHGRAAAEAQGGAATHVAALHAAKQQLELELAKTAAAQAEAQRTQEELQQTEAGTRIAVAHARATTAEVRAEAAELQQSVSDLEKQLCDQKACTESMADQEARARETISQLESDVAALHAALERGGAESEVLQNALRGQQAHTNVLEETHQQVATAAVEARFRAEQAEHQVQELSDKAEALEVDKARLTQENEELVRANNMARGELQQAQAAEVVAEAAREVLESKLQHAQERARQAAEAQDQAGQKLELYVSREAHWQAEHQQLRFKVDELDSKLQDALAEADQLQEKLAKHDKVARELEAERDQANFRIAHLEGRAEEAGHWREISGGAASVSRIAPPKSTAKLTREDTTPRLRGGEASADGAQLAQMKAEVRLLADSLQETTSRLQVMVPTVAVPTRPGLPLPGRRTRPPRSDTGLGLPVNALAPHTKQLSRQRREEMAMPGHGEVKPGSQMLVSELAAMKTHLSHVEAEAAEYAEELRSVKAALHLQDAHASTSARFPPPPAYPHAAHPPQHVPRWPAQAPVGVPPWRRAEAADPVPPTPEGNPGGPAGLEGERGGDEGVMAMKLLQLQSEATARLIAAQQGSVEQLTEEVEALRKGASAPHPHSHSGSGTDGGTDSSRGRGRSRRGDPTKPALRSNVQSSSAMEGAAPPFAQHMSALETPSSAYAKRRGTQGAEGAVVDELTKQLTKLGASEAAALLNQSPSIQNQLRRLQQ
ncbi:hypothetical protein CYMTET_50926 [Cymbomonas tetramitiformis]|uniref:Uncharacterized protein n=1 Tax=Cymbomonas tetramitiformis TaxID=36881 RepID=A0AAE0BM51_9CHLO|nr:hypothetical protein CYMTET_50926 [Cymbomonas tetramitiformis]